jgi:hypothetical protein
MVEEPTNNVSVRGARDVGAPANWDSFAPTIGIEKKLDLLTRYQRAARDKLALRREQW